MTIEELATKRNAILASIGIASAKFGERSIEYARQQEALALIDAEIVRAQSTGPRTSFVQHSRE